MLISFLFSLLVEFLHMVYFLLNWGIDNLLKHGALKVGVNCDLWKHGNKKPWPARRVYYWRPHIIQIKCLVLYQVFGSFGWGNLYLLLLGLNVGLHGAERSNWQMYDSVVIVIVMMLKMELYIKTGDYLLYWCTLKILFLKVKV